MSSRFIIGFLIVVGLGVAIMEGVPQKAWTWFAGTDVATKIFSLSGSEQKLPGPLRGFLDGGAAEISLERDAIIDATNVQREKQGLTALHMNAKLNAAAMAKVDDMFAQQYFEHESPNGKSPADVIRAASYEFIVVGENLALGNFKTDAVLVQAWMDSPGHRANILNTKFQEIGVAAKRGMFEGREVWLAVQEFGAPLSSCPSPKKGLKLKIEENRSQLVSDQAALQRQKAALESSRYANEDEYNAAVAQYNALVKKINSLSETTQALVAEFNEAVNEFNKCLESNS